MPHNRTPKLKVTEVRDDFLSFELTETDISMANSLRRIMIAEVPTICIDLVEFNDNTSPLQDEFLAHRLGLVPLRSLRPSDEWNYSHACDCIGDGNCEKCTAILTLDVEFDKLAKTELLGSEEAPYIAVTSNHLVCHNPYAQVVHFSNEDEEQRSYDKGIVLVKIGPGQRIKLKAFAKKGIGKEHAKWSPVSTVALKYDPIVKLNEDMYVSLDPWKVATCLSVHFLLAVDRLDQYTEEQKQAVVDCCPQEVFAYDTTTRAVTVKDAAACIFCKECIFTLEEFKKKPEDDLGVSIQHSSNKFYFTVETNGSMTATEVVREAIKQLQNKLGRLQKSLQKGT